MTSKKLLTIFAHPDDETFATGGTITKCVRHGVEVYSVVATKGESGLRAGYENDPRPTPVIREEELKRAADILGIREVRFLGFIDGTLVSSDLKHLKDKVRREVEDIKPQVILTFEPGGVSAHPDHQTVSKLVTELVKERAGHWPFFKRLYYVGMPVSTTDRIKDKEKAMDGKPHRGIPDEKIDVWSNITDYFEIKVKAMKAHRSQINDIKRILSRDQDLLFKETFVQAWPNKPKASQDFFEGL